MHRRSHVTRERFTTPPVKFENLIRVFPFIRRHGIVFQRRIEKLIRTRRELLDMAFEITDVIWQHPETGMRLRTSRNHISSRQSLHAPNRTSNLKIISIRPAIRTTTYRRTVLPIPYPERKFSMRIEHRPGKILFCDSTAFRKTGISRQTNRVSHILALLSGPEQRRRIAVNALIINRRRRDTRLGVNGFGFHKTQNLNVNTVSSSGLD